MNTVKVKIKKLRVLNVSPNTKQIYLNLLFNSADKSKEILKEYKLTTPEILVKCLILDIREKEKQENLPDEEDEILGKMVIINIENIDEVQAKLEHFFGKLNDKIRELKNLKVHESYIDKYVALRGAEITL